LGLHKNGEPKQAAALTEFNHPRNVRAVAAINMCEKMHHAKDTEESKVSDNEKVGKFNLF